MAANWVDLLDPSADELRANSPRDLEETALELLLADPQHEDEPRPTLQGHGDYVFGIFIAAVAAPDGDRVYYQEIGLVITHDTLLTVRKTPPNDRPPYSVDEMHTEGRDDDVPGMIAYRIVDDIAERYLDLVDAIDGEIDELEDKVESQSAELTRRRVSQLRHDILRVRRALAPMRDAIRRVVGDGEEVPPTDVEVAFNAAYDKLMRALDGLDLRRDLLAGVRDSAQAKVSNDQNEVMKRLTVVASLLLLPTSIVGLYGQSFVDIPELRWHYGYAYAWGVIVVTTLMQLWYFRRKNWF